MTCEAVGAYASGVGNPGMIGSVASGTAAHKMGVLIVPSLDWINAACACFRKRTAVLSTQL